MGSPVLRAGFRETRADPEKARVHQQGTGTSPCVFFSGGAGIPPVSSSHSPTNPGVTVRHERRRIFSTIPVAREKTAPSQSRLFVCDAGWKGWKAGGTGGYARDTRREERDGVTGWKPVPPRWSRRESPSPRPSPRRAGRGREVSGGCVDQERIRHRLSVGVCSRQEYNSAELDGCTGFRREGESSARGSGCVKTPRARARGSSRCEMIDREPAQNPTACPSLRWSLAAR